MGGDSDDEGSDTREDSEELEQNNNKSNDAEVRTSDVSDNSGSGSTVTKSGRVRRRPSW